MKQEIKKEPLRLLSTNSEKLQQRMQKFHSKIIPSLFAKFSIIYGHKWTNIISSKEIAQLAIEEWTAGLNNLTNDQILIALKKCSLICEWPPSIAEFRRLAFDLPTIDDAFARAKQPDAPLMIKEMLMLCGDSYTRKCFTEVEFRHRFASAYKTVTTKILEGKND